MPLLAAFFNNKALYGINVSLINGVVGSAVVLRELNMYVNSDQVLMKVFKLIF